MTEHNFFMHLNSTNVAGYISCACLKPAKYFQNRIEDVQSKCDYAVLLSTKRYDSESDCSFEVVLTKQEKDSLLLIENCKEIFVFFKAIPLSRLCKIYFKSDDTRDKIISLVNLSSGFIPEKMVSVIADNDFADYTGFEIPKDFNAVDLSKNIKQFDSLLGGFSLMRLACEEYMNYSENYFSTLSRFNTVIEAELVNANKMISDIYWDAFEGKDSFKNLYSYINKLLTSDDLNTIAANEGQLIQKNSLSGIIDINSLDRGTYVVAVLYSYGMSEEGRKNKIDGLILNNFKKDIKPGKSEVIALCYGLNRGYTCFSNKYKTTATEKTVKFELNSQVDYYTIESLYQYAFNDIKKSGEFPYLDNWIPKYPKVNRRLKKSEYLVLDKVVSGEVIKVGSTRWWSGLLSGFFSKTGEEYFKPFIQKLYDKIKSDVELEYQDQIADKDEFIAELNSEIIKLRNKNSEVDSLQAQIEKLKDEIDALKSARSTVAESKSEYLPTKVSDEGIVELRNKIDALQKLIKEIDSQCKSGKAKVIIKKFYQQNNVNTIKFPGK